MAKVTIETPDGVKAEFLHAYGKTLPIGLSRFLPYGEDLGRHFADIKRMNIREDDLYLLTYPKCGTHWTWEIMSMLQRGSAEHEENTKATVFLDLRPLDSIDARPSPRILNGHLPLHLTPEGIFKQKTKIVHVMRNPKDVFVSMYHHFKSILNGLEFAKDFRTFLPFALGTYGLSVSSPFFQFVKDWETFTEANPDQIINLFYEDIKENPVREIKKVNKFLGTNRDDDLIEQIAAACDFQTLKKADAEFKVKE